MKYSTDSRRTESSTRHTSVVRDQSTESTENLQSSTNERSATLALLLLASSFKVALVRRLASLIDKSIDHWRMEKEFGPVLDAATSVGLQSTDSDGFSEDEVDEDDDGGDEHKLEEGEDEDQQGDESRLAEGSVSNQIALRASTLRALRNKASEVSAVLQPDVF